MRSGATRPTSAWRSVACLDMSRHPPRTGVALVAALAILALSSALLAGTWNAALVAMRAARSERATLEAGCHATRAIAVFLEHASAPDTTLPIGLSVERDLTSDERGGTNILETTGRLRVERLDAHLYAVAVDVRIGGDLTLAVGEPGAAPGLVA